MNRGLLLTLLVLITLTSTGYAQTWSEWFKQKKTQQKYSLLQIAKLQLYLGYVKKGYAIVQEGLTIVGDIKRGDLLQHAEFFNRLSIVNPQIRKYAKFPQVILRQQQMLELYKKFNNQFRQANVFSPNEVSYIDRVFTALFDDVATQIDDLTTLLSDHQLEMSDQERITRIDKLSQMLENKYQFLFSFCQQTDLQQGQRTKELKDIQTLQQLIQP